jgi:uncharacterized protein (DUF885 family)
MRFGKLLGAVLLLAAGTAVGATRKPATPPAASAAHGSAAARFKAIYTDEWKWREAELAGGEAEGGGDAVPDRLPRVDPASQARRLARWLDVRARLDALPPTRLKGDDAVDYAVYREQIDTLIAQQRFKEYEKPFNSDTAFWSTLDYAAMRTLHDEKDVERYLAYLADVPRWFDEQTANLRAGLARGFTAPRATLAGREAPVAAVAQAASAEATPFWKPLEHLPGNVPEPRREALKARARTIILERVRPAYATLLAFLRDEYIPHAAEALAAERLPDGAAYYRAQIREFTTLDESPEAIHAFGLREVAKIHAEMLKVMAETGFEGDFAAFLAMLRSDPRFYAKTPEELLMRAAWIAKRVDGKLDAWFGWLPRARFGIEPVPADIAPFYTSGRGGDTYLLNTYDLPSRPLYNLVALTLHESAPGHSLQMALAAEHEHLPEFRRSNYISAYGEGWALYCEKLGLEMGLYDTPYDRFGMLTFQMWRAARLVIDTGLHHEGWTRAQAVAYLHDHTALAQHDIETEVDRYISWPGQALSYYLGMAAIVEMRAKAEAALGPKFDVRAFHDTILSTGSVPLPVLRARIDRFIADGGRDPMPVKWQEAGKKAP